MSAVTHTKSFEITQPIDVLFPLFSAEGEKLWVPGWDYENVMGSTDLHEDYVFMTKSHDHGTTNAIWLVKRHEPDHHFVQFYKVEPDDKVGIVSVKCDAINNGLTKVQVTYEYIGLSEKGNKFIQTFTADTYAEFIGEWEQLLTAYFKTGS